MLKKPPNSATDQQINEQLHAQFLAKDEIIRAKDMQIAQLKESYDFLQSQLDALKRMIFGSKSERFIDPESKQPSLLDEQDFSDVDATGAEIPGKLIQVSPHSRKKKVNPHKSLPRRKVIITLTEAEMLCECGACKDVIRTEVKEIINYVPPIFELIEQHRQVAACPKCKEGVVTAPAPLQILPKVGVSETFLSYLVVSKFQDRQPLYHLESKMYSYGVDCSRQNMARWLIDLVEPLRPIYNLLKDNIVEYDVASCDATSLQVLKEPDRSAQIKSDVYCMLGGPPDKSVVLYDYNAKKHKEFVSNWFTGFKGYLHVDADNSFDLVATNGAVLSCCNAHARRKFEPIAKATKGHGVAKQALLYYSKLYKIEREAKDKKLNHEQRHLLRQEKSKPIMAEFYAWLDKLPSTVLPESALGKAVAYAMNHRVELMRFLNDGRLEMDNNHTERMIKPLVITRKNFMFCNSVAGANAVCMHFGLIQTAKLHGLDPYEYYVILLTNIPHCRTLEGYEKLLPWNIKAKSTETQGD